MKVLLRKKFALVFLAPLPLLFLSFATQAPAPALGAVNAVVSGDRVDIRVMPSRFTVSLGACSAGQPLTLWAPSLFDFYRARCNGIVGWVARDRVIVTD